MNYLLLLNLLTYLLTSTFYLQKFWYGYNIFFFENCHNNNDNYLRTPSLPNFDASNAQFSWD